MCACALHLYRLWMQLDNQACNFLMQMWSFQAPQNYDSIDQSNGWIFPCCHWTQLLSGKRTWHIFLIFSMSGSLKCKSLCLTLRTWDQNCSYFAALTAHELYIFSWLYLHLSATNPLILNLSAQLWQRHPYSSFAPRRPPMNHLMHISFTIIVAGRSGSFHSTWL